MIAGNTAAGTKNINELQSLLYFYFILQNFEKLKPTGFAKGKENADLTKCFVCFHFDF